MQIHAESGPQVSILEMMATRAHVVSYDNSTRGLDVSLLVSPFNMVTDVQSKLDFVKCLRIAADIFGETTFVSLYQAGESIYKLFDKVMVLDHGRQVRKFPNNTFMRIAQNPDQVYFGPAGQVRDYFVGLGFENKPRQSTADFATGCTDPHERRIAPGIDPSTVPQTPEGLELAFKASGLYSDLIAERDEYLRGIESEKTDREEFKRTVLEDHRKHASKKSPYNTSCSGQVKALVIRQARLTYQDRFTLYSNLIITTVSELQVG